MNSYIINGGKALDGGIFVQSAKNAVLPFLAASVLTDEKMTLESCPDILDVGNMLKILTGMGAKVTREKGNIEIDSSNVVSGAIPDSLAKELRSSIFLLGSILSRLKVANVPYPGGCDIGLRPIDLHLKAFRELNIAITEEGGYIHCDAADARPADIYIDIPSVGATENIMMAAVCLRGRTTIRNAAKEPEIVDLQTLLNKMGAKICGAGGSTIYIDGVKTLRGATHKPMPDRIVAGTYIILCAMCGGELELSNVCWQHIYSLISRFNKTTCKIEAKGDKIYIKSSGRMPGFDCIETSYYPGFPTDLQAQIMALETIADGTTIIKENIFENRFKQVPEFIKLGAHITVHDKMSIVRGVKNLRGAEVKAHDLRGGAALVLAGAAAKGQTTVTDIHHIDRGYEAFEKGLASIGVDIIRK